MKKFFFFVMAALFCGLTSSAQQANIYASGLKAGAVADGKVPITYFLNTDATALEVNFVDGTQTVAVPITDAALLTKGAHTADVSLATVPAGTYKWEVKATGAATAAEPVKVSDDAEHLGFHALRGIAVDNSFESPYFGRVYATEGAENTAAPSIRTTNDGIYIYNSALEDVTNQGNAAWTGGITWGLTGAGANSGASPFRVTVAPDGMVFVTDWSDTHSGIYLLDAGDPSADLKPVFGGTRDGNGVSTEGADQIHGSISHCYIEGTDADTKLYTFDEDLGGTGIVGNMYRYDIGTLDNPWVATPSALIYDDAANGNLQQNGNSCISPDGRGGWWISQYRASDVNSAVPSLIHWNGTSVDFISATDAPGVVVDTYQGGMALNDDKTMMVLTGSGAVRVFDIAFDDAGKPSIALKHTITTTHGTNSYSVALDRAYNVYVGGNASAFSVFALPKPENSFTTPAPTYSTITSTTPPPPPQANIYASGLKAEKVDATRHKLTYTLNANATSGRIIVKTGTVVGQPTTSEQSLSGDELDKGTHSVIIYLSDIADGKYDWSIAVEAAPNAAIVQVTDDAAVNLKFGGSRAFALDNSFESPGFGRMYFGVANPSDEATAGRALTKGVYILDAALEDVTGQGNTGWNGAGFSGTTQSSPIRAWVGPDGKAYFSDWSDGHPGAFVMSPTDPTDFGPVFGGTVGASGVTTNAAGEFIHGSYGHNIVIMGEGDDAKIYSIDEDYPGGANSLLVHNIGKSPYPYEGAAALFTPTGLLNYGSLALDGVGGLWAAQSRVVDQDIASVPALIHIKADGSIDYKSGDLSDLGAANGGAIALAPDGEHLIVGATKTAGGDSKQVAIYWPLFDATGSLIDLGAPETIIPTWSNETSGVGIDVAGNVYAVTGTALGFDKRLSIFATPKSNNSFTTPAPASEKIYIGVNSIPTVTLDSRIRISTSNGFLRLTAEGTTIQSYTLYNVSGARVASKAVAANNAELSTSRLNAGVYLLQIATAEGTVVKKVVVR